MNSKSMEEQGKPVGNVVVKLKKSFLLEDPHIFVRFVSLKKSTSGRISISV